MHLLFSLILYSPICSVPAVIKVFEVNQEDGTLANGRVFFNSSDTK